MTFEFDMPDNVEPGRGFVEKGQYHLIISKVDTAPTKTNGAIIEGFKVTFQVLNGTLQQNGICTQTGKSFDELFNYPSPAHRDGGDFAKRLLARLAIATGLVSINDKGKRVSVDWSHLATRQLVAFVDVEEQQGTDGKTYKNSGIEGMHMYGVDDPAVAHVPKDEKSAKFAAKTQPAAVNGSGATAAATQPAPTQPAAPPVGTAAATAVAAAATADPNSWNL